MDEICGWREEQQWIESLFAACKWIYTGVLDKEDAIHYVKCQLGLFEEAFEEHGYLRSPFSGKKKNWRSSMVKSIFFVWYKGGFLWLAALSRVNVKLDSHDARIAKLQTWQLRQLSKFPTKDATHHARVFCGQLQNSWIVCLMRTGTWTSVRIICASALVLLSNLNFGEKWYLLESDKDNVAFSLKVNAPLFLAVLGVLRRAGTSFQD